MPGVATKDYTECCRRTKGFFFRRKNPGAVETVALT